MDANGMLSSVGGDVLNTDAWAFVHLAGGERWPVARCGGAGDDR